MAEINVKQARQNLRSVLERVAAGEEIVLLRHNRPVARLMPPEPAAARLPSLAELRRSVELVGRPLSREVLAGGGLDAESPGRDGYR